MSETGAPEAADAVLFVYGTLKRGGANHGWLDGQTFLGPAHTAPGLTLYLLGEYPGLVAAPSDREGVRGELWLVDAACLARLDAFEGVPEQLYAREPARLAEVPPGIPPADASRAQLYRYLRKVDPRAHLGAVWPV